MSDMLRRQRALEKTMAKYRRTAFEWGRADCIAMVRSHLVALGHRGLPKLPRYANALGAKRALAGLGFESVEALLDAHLPRIAPAMMLPGDVGLISGGEDGLDAAVICVGHKVFGFHQDATGGVVIIPKEIKVAYRV